MGAPYCVTPCTLPKFEQRPVPYPQHIVQDILRKFGTCILYLSTARQRLGCKCCGIWFLTQRYKVLL